MTATGFFNGFLWVSHIGESYLLAMSVEDV